MKQFKFSAFLLAVLCLSCQEEVSLGNLDAAGPQDSAIVFKAESEPYEVKTSCLDGDILWNAGDRISVFQGSDANGLYQVTAESAGSTSAELVPVPEGGSAEGSVFDANIAVYPYSSDNSVQQNGEVYEVSMTLPQIQHYVEGSFGNGSFPMVAVTADAEDTNLRFKNILGCLKIQLQGNAVIKSISVTSRASEILWGPAVVSASSTETPTITLSDASAKTVILDCGEGVQLSNDTATPFMIALPPVQFRNGFVIEITDINGARMTKVATVQGTTKIQKIERSHVLKMPVLMAEDKQYVDLGLPSGTLWAKTNLGAISPDYPGDYYAWGETKTLGEEDSTNLRNYEFNLSNYPDSPYVKHAFMYVSYKFTQAGTDNTSAKSRITKYTWADGQQSVIWYIGDRFVGDGLTELEPEDDAATANWGDGWRMPTRAEMQELLDNCTITRTQTTVYINGRIYNYLVNKFTSRINGNSISIPSCLHMSNTSLANQSSAGHGVWTSSLYIKAGEDLPIYSHQAAELVCKTGETKVWYTDRVYGLPIRPVKNN